jgi:alcohol dehydrogenase
MQQEYIGFGKLAHLGDVLELNGVQRPLFVTGRSSFESSGALETLSRVLPGFTEAPRFSDYALNPRLEDALAGCDALNSHGCDSIVAVGGGSAIDLAKLINAFHADVAHARDVATGRRPMLEQTLPLIAVPTTAGTGSEATHFAVVYVDGVKFSLAHAGLLPTAAIVDPELSLGLPAYQTASTGFDALCQAVESCWAVSSTATSRGLSIAAIRLIVANLEQAIKEPSSRSVRLSMAIAANLSGKAIDITKTTAPHAISYTLTSRYGVPHGHAVALTLGRFFAAHGAAAADDVLDPRGKPHLDAVMAELAAALNVATVHECESAWYEFMARCGLETDLSRLGLLGDDDIEAVVDGVNTERLSNHPVKVSRAQIRGFLETGASTSR